MPADALAPSVARTSATMVLIKQDRGILVFHMVGFQLFVASQFWKMWIYFMLPENRFSMIRVKPPAGWAYGLLWCPLTAINNVVFWLIKFSFLYWLFELKFTTTTTTRYIPPINTIHAKCILPHHLTLDQYDENLLLVRYVLQEYISCHSIVFIATSSYKHHQSTGYF